MTSGFKQFNPQITTAGTKTLAIQPAPPASPDHGAVVGSLPLKFPTCRSPDIAGKLVEDAQQIT
jgi:hypothetical protein